MNDSTLTATDREHLERFHRVLATIIREERPGGLSRPVTVAELYQDLASYPRMREPVGLEMHADYEHALVRLLAGEGGRVRLEPETARDELRRELEHDDPNLSIYRRFAACEVWVGEPGSAAPAPGTGAGQEPGGSRNGPAPQRSRQAGGATDAAPPWAQAGARQAEPEPGGAPAPSRSTDLHAAPAPAVRPAAPAPGASAAPTAPSAPPASVPASPEAAARPATGKGPAGSSCEYCGGALPAGREVHYCPHCGSDQRLRPCAECSAPLEAAWRFCVACGAEAG